MPGRRCASSRARSRSLAPDGKGDDLERGDVVGLLVRTDHGVLPAGAQADARDHVQLQQAIGIDLQQAVHLRAQVHPAARGPRQGQCARS